MIAGGGLVAGGREAMLLHQPAYERDQFDKLRDLAADDFVEAAACLLAARGFGDDLDNVLKPALSLADQMRDGEISRAEFIERASSLFHANQLGDDLVSLTLGEMTLLIAEDSRGAVSQMYRVFYRRYASLIDELMLLKQTRVNPSDTTITITSMPVDPGRQRDTLSAVLKHCRTFGKLLEVGIIMTDAYKLDESVLRTFLQQIDGCQVTKLKGYNNVTSRGRLTQLDLSRSALSDMAAKSIAAFCPGLRSLKLAGCSNLTDEGLSTVAKFCTNLRELDVCDCKQVTSASLDLVPSRCLLTR
ncbi:hypothetical protein AB1Y20_001308 [Prymnesium parvum]|uniref:Uncharacterized protein n=1 Tax=Prymnesium parvum TaxID=97485 RepID=A0AB34K7E9_PRYPA